MNTCGQYKISINDNGQTVSRVLYLTIIFLDLRSPAGSSDLPSGKGRAAPFQALCSRSCLPAWSCSGWGLHGSCVSTAPVSSYLTISTLPRPYPFRRNVSVALSLQLPAADVIRHPCPAEPGLSSCMSTRSSGLPKILLYYNQVQKVFNALDAFSSSFIRYS